MDRRGFLRCGLSSVVLGLGMDRSNRDALAVSFSVSDADVDATEAEKILIEFSNFDLQPRYLDSSDPLSVSVTVNSASFSSTSKTAEGVGFSNGESLSASDIRSRSSVDLSYIVVDGVSSDDSYLSGSVTITVSHPSLSEDVSYIDSFTVGSNAVIIDGFETNDLSSYSGDKGAFNTQNSVVREGSYALNGTANNNLIYSHSGLDYYPKAGDVIEWFVRGDNSNSGAGLTLGVPGSSGPNNNGGYQLRVEADQNSLAIKKWNSGGGVSNIGSSEATISENKWYKARFEWGLNGSLDLFLIDPVDGSNVSSVKKDNSDYTSGGIALGTSPSTGDPDVFFDSIRKVDDLSG